MIGGCDLEKGPWIAGGAARQLWYDNMDYQIHDIDVFFPNWDAFNEAVSKLEHTVNKPFRNLFLSLLTGVDQLHKVSQTKNALTYHCPLLWNDRQTAKLQFIKKKFYQNTTELFDDFDFTACLFATDGTRLMADEAAIRDCDSRVLRRNTQYDDKIRYHRVIKYNTHGFVMDEAITKVLIDHRRNGNVWRSDDDY